MFSLRDSKGTNPSTYIQEIEDAEKERKIKRTDRTFIDQ